MTGTTVCCCYLRCRNIVGLFWQKQLVVEFQDAYFNNKTMYAANKMVPSLDNMDQVHNVVMLLW